MTPEQIAWIQAYSAILAGLLGNPEIRLDWELLRARAEAETNNAFKKAVAR